ncbi:MAG: 2-amino-4-hydroxy-6-hydroxymethyldihydropteridine diphosphokinase [Pseudohongiellaceae bacterium]
MSFLSNTTDSRIVTAVVSLGSNLPDGSRSPKQLVLLAMERLRQFSIDSLSSSLYRSKPQDCPAGSDDFINAVMVLQLPALLSAHELLNTVQGIESDFSRQRGVERNQARTLDIDIISYENHLLATKELTLPHPRAAQRRFVLMPLAEIDPEWVLPGQALNISRLLDRLAGSENVQKIQ